MIPTFTVNAGVAAECRQDIRTAADAPLQVLWARHQDEVRAAQRLRYQVFAQEGGAELDATGTLLGIDIDEFDPHCEHLIVSRAETADTPAEVVGTYRVLLPEAARRLGRYYTETEFDISRLNPLRPGMAELGRSCIAAPWRTGGVILLLWSHLIRFLSDNGVQQAIGCASVPMPDGGANAASLWRELQQNHLAEPQRRVVPRNALPVHLLPHASQAQWPPLVKGYVKCGSVVLGPPAWDAGFGTADFPMMLDIDRMNPAYRRRFLGA